MKNVLIVVVMAGILAALSLGRNAMARGGSVSTLDLAGAAGVFVVWAVIVAVALVVIGRVRRR